MFPLEVSSPASDYQLRKANQAIDSRDPGKHVHTQTPQGPAPSLIPKPNKQTINPSLLTPLRPHQGRKANQREDWVTEFQWYTPPHTHTTLKTKWGIYSNEGKEFFYKTPLAAKKAF